MHKPSAAGKIRVAIVDDHPLMLRGIIETLSEAADIELIGTGGSAQEAIQLAKLERPDLILLDVALPGDGIEAAREIARACPGVKIVMLTVREDRATVRAALRAGARGYVVKGIEGPELIATLRSILSGDVYISPGLAAQLLADRAHAPTPPAATLTTREQEIMTLLASGMSNLHIASRLDLSESTVKHYVTRILQKLGLRNRTEVAIFARKQ